jgi:tetratricopeptide (TPR) repeat protein
MASGYEKAFHKAVQAFSRGDADDALRLFRDSSEKDTKDRALANDLFAGIISAQVHQDDDAISFLEQVVTSERSLPDELMEKYVPGGGIELPVTESLSVEVPFGSLAAALVLAEVYQRNGRLDDAIGLLQQLVDVDAADPFLIASLCDLYAEQGAWDDIVEVAAGTTNDDDATLQIRIFQAGALQEQGMNDAALEVYKDALKPSSATPSFSRKRATAAGAYT